jgi:viroplasmin and RNaseH domain-containing protein
MIITKFYLFCEARLADILNIKGGGDLVKQMSDIKDAEFDLNKKLVKLITLKKRVNNKKIQFEINWNDSATHNLVKRIKERTSFGSVEDFNQYFKGVFNRIFPDMVGKEIFVSGRYSLYSKEYNFSMIINFNIDEYSDGIYEVDIITILPGKKGNNVVKLIDIL